MHALENNLMNGWLNKLEFGGRATSRSSGVVDTEGALIVEGPNYHVPNPN